MYPLCMVSGTGGLSSLREMAVKFNDYFEFPKEFDMAPYTAATLAKMEGGCGIVEIAVQLNLGCYFVLWGVLIQRSLVLLDSITGKVCLF